jgi:hypothetical protein
MLSHQGTNTLERYPPLDPNFERLKPTIDAERSIFGLYFDKTAIGTCVAIHPRIVISAGHHFLIKSDEVGSLSIRHPKPLAPSSTGTGTGKHIQVEYAQKDLRRDLLVLWLTEDVPFIPFRGIQAPEGLRVAVCYVNPRQPIELIVSPGFVSLSTRHVCQVRGTATTHGASGGAVLDHHGDTLLGIHLGASDNTPGQVRVSEFIGCREILRILGEMEVDPTAPWPDAPTGEGHAAPAVKEKPKGRKRGRSV